MLIICKSPKFVFIRPQKVASSTIIYVLKKYFNIPKNDGYNHLNYKQVKQYFRDNYMNFNKFTKFSCVRNPWDSMVSYFWWKNRETINPNLPFEDIKNQFTTFVIEQKTTEKPFNRDFFGPHEKYDFIIKYENLEEDMFKLTKRLGLSLNKKAVKNLLNADVKKDFNLKRDVRKSKRPYQDYYTDETKQIIADTYSYEIKRFNYTF